VVIATLQLALVSVYFERHEARIPLLVIASTLGAIVEIRGEEINSLDDSLLISL